MKNDVCWICPRHCRVDRNIQKGFCNENKTLRIAKILEHFQWEEPCICGGKGTFAVFFSGCNLRCQFCQNIKISRGGVGKLFSVQEFANLIENAQKTHESIDLVTPTHFAENLIEAFEKIDKKVPVIWNSNGYETPQMIEKVSKFVDIFLVDFKYASNLLGEKFSGVKDYFSQVVPAIEKMCQQKSDVFDNSSPCPQMKQGVIIRHLVLPGQVENSLRVLDEIKANFPQRMISVMSQFTPNGVGLPNRKLLPIEYKTVLLHMEKLGLEKGYIQDFCSAENTFVPEF